MDSYGQWHGDGTSVAGLRRGLRGSVGLDRGLRSSISVFHGGLRGSVSIFFRRGLRGSIGFFLLRGSVLLRGLRGTVGVQLGGGVPGVPLLCNVRFKGKLVIKFIFGVRGSWLEDKLIDWNLRVDGNGLDDGGNLISLATSNLEE
jgi:hypothetical protein